MFGERWHILKVKLDGTKLEVFDHRVVAYVWRKEVVEPNEHCYRWRLYSTVEILQCVRNWESFDHLKESERKKI